MRRVPTIQAVPLGETETNAYLVSGADGDPNGCWIVDPGVGPARLVAEVRRQNLEPRAILLTHAHYDHIGGVDAVEAALGRLPIHLHACERDFCSGPVLNLSAFGGRPVTCREPDHELVEGQWLELGTSRWKVLHTPGHSPGSVCLLDAEAGLALVGDLIFAGSIGRTVFPTSDLDAMAESLERIQREFADETILHPGHGPSTTMGIERRRNPFLQPGALR